VTVTQVEPGTVLAGKYRLLKMLGKGAMGSVWKAEHLDLKQELAIKVIDPGAAKAEMGMVRFVREAQAAAALRSPHVVQIRDFGREGELAFIAMELLDGESLGDRLRREDALSPTETARLMVHVCEGIANAHEHGVIHRDLKPDNIFLCNTKGESVAKLVDFGIAKAVKVDGPESMVETRTGSMLGTPYYMSPEQCRGAKDLDARTDLWALGVIAYECIVGARPFTGDTVGALAMSICADPPPIPSGVADVPAGFDAWFARATDRNRQARFGDAREMARRLSDVCHGVTTVVRVPSRGQQADPLTTTKVGALDFSGPIATEKPPLRRAPLLIGGVAAAVALVGVLALMSGGEDEGRAPEDEAAKAIEAAMTAEPKATLVTNTAHPVPAPEPQVTPAVGVEPGKPDPATETATPTTSKAVTHPPAPTTAGMKAHPKPKVSAKKPSEAAAPLDAEAARKARARTLFGDVTEQ
jgi:hypothetical protein